LSTDRQPRHHNFEADFSVDFTTNIAESDFRYVIRRVQFWL